MISAAPVPPINSSARGGQQAVPAKLPSIGGYTRRRTRGRHLDFRDRPPRPGRRRAVHLRGVVTVEDLLDLAAVDAEFAGYRPLAAARIVPGAYRLFQERTRRWHTLARHRHRQADRGLAEALRPGLVS